MERIFARRYSPQGPGPERVSFEIESFDEAMNEERGEKLGQVFRGSLAAALQTLERLTTISERCPDCLPWIDGELLIKVYRQLGALIHQKQMRSKYFRNIWEKAINSSPIPCQPVSAQARTEMDSQLEQAIDAEYTCKDEEPNGYGMQ